MTNFEWLIKYRPDVTLAILQGKPTYCFARISKTDMCTEHKCKMPFMIDGRGVCRTRFRFWLMEEHKED